MGLAFPWTTEEFIYIPRTNASMNSKVRSLAGDHHLIMFRLAQHYEDGGQE
ncbi:hypothetical protein TorRG33x02_110190 [Trema orientale]|uniref:Uncharacterized protein n=1 Tax=Trema orientale TaxID=63057 RepID=A0A2P5F5P4_TREOI|nr:hypothetical protein TorRG33x02_110190 [Trema orientale]